MHHASARVAAALFALGHCLTDFYGNFLPVLLPIIIPQLGLSLTLCGLLVMVMSISCNLMQPVVGYFMDKYNFTRLLVPVLPVGALAMTAIGLIDTKLALFTLVALSGLTSAIYHPLGSTLVMKSTSAENRGSIMSYYIAGGNLGYAIAPLVLVAFIAAAPLEYLPLVAIPALLIAPLYKITGLTSYSTLPEVGGKNDAETITNADANETGENTTTPAAAPLSLSEMLKNSRVMRLNISMGLRCVTHVAVSTFLPLLLIGEGLSQSASGLLLALFLVGCTAGGLIGGYLGDRYSHKAVIVGALVIGFFPTYYFFTHAGMEPLSLAALFIAGACILAPQPSSVVWTQRLLPANPAMASAMMMGLSFGLGSIGTAITAAAADIIGLPTAILLTSLPLLAAAAISYSVPYQN